jgi:hypothetical protein
MPIIDVMKCKDGIVILLNGKSTAFKGDWMISEWQDKTVEEVKKFKRIKSEKKIKTLKEIMDEY